MEHTGCRDPLQLESIPEPRASECLTLPLLTCFICHWGKHCEKMHLTLGWAFVKSYVNVVTERSTTFPRTSGTTDEKRSSEPLQIVSPQGETVKQKQLNQWGMYSPECLSLDLRDTAGNLCQKKCLFIDWAIGSACHADSASIFSINDVGWYCNSLFCHVLPGKKNRDQLTAALTRPRQDLLVEQKDYEVVLCSVEYKESVSGLLFN